MYQRNMCNPNCSSGKLRLFIWPIFSATLVQLLERILGSLPFPLSIRETAGSADILSKVTKGSLWPQASIAVSRANSYNKHMAATVDAVPLSGRGFAVQTGAARVVKQNAQECFSSLFQKCGANFAGSLNNIKEILLLCNLLTARSLFWLRSTLPRLWCTCNFIWQIAILFLDLCNRNAFCSHLQRETHIRTTLLLAAKL